MEVEVVFVGTKFLYNKSLKDYILRVIEKEYANILGIKFLKDNDSSLFLYIENIFSNDNKTIIVTSKNNLSIISKIISTTLMDSLVLNNDMLVPSTVEMLKERSYLVKDKVNVVVMDELEKMPELLLKRSIDNYIIHLFGEDEESAKALLETLSQTYEIKIEYIRIVQGWLKLNIKSKKYGNISKFIFSTKQLLQNKIVITSNIIEHIIETLYAKNKKIVFAESCTGGLLSYFLTKHNGASKILEGSLVTYSNHLKENWLAVDEKALIEYGAVSKEVVEQMSEGALNVSGADYAISISGIAGDSGGSEEKPVGTVFIGVRNKQNHIEKNFLFKGDRNYVQSQSALNAIKMLLELDKEMFFGNVS
jgi:nicotinamide-nucleotide amidase